MYRGMYFVRRGDKQVLARGTRGGAWTTANAVDMDGHQSRHASPIRAWTGVSSPDLPLYFSEQAIHHVLELWRVTRNCKRSGSDPTTK
jgi:hypothetical protein